MAMMLPQVQLSDAREAELVKKTDDFNVKNGTSLTPAQYAQYYMRQEWLDVGEQQRDDSMWVRYQAAFRRMSPADKQQVRALFQPYLE